MVFVGVHREWGRIDVTQADLGCGHRREEIHKTGTPSRVTCRECSWTVHMVHRTHNRGDLWFLRHAAGAPDCAARLGESMQHHLLKMELAAHVRAVPGWSAEYEVSSPDGSWRADVLATGPGGRRIALEAQLAAASVADIEERTARYAAAGVECCWFTDRKTVPWLDRAPSVQVRRPDDGGDVQVTAGCARFEPRWCHDRQRCERTFLPEVDLPCAGHGQWKPVATFPLARFVAGLCRDTTRPRPVPLEDQAATRMRWITAQYLALEAEQHQAHARHEQARERRFAELERESAERARHRRAIEELLERQNDLRRPVEDYVHARTGVYPYVDDDPDPDLAMGLGVYADGDDLYGVICPVAGRVAACRDALASAVVFAASDRERDRIAAQASPVQRTEVIIPLDRPGR
ncbi:hypothetical protein ACFY2W_36290 [Streptomyces sp. NPDC001262]|uniref:competence protein CoiA family protein n=1 Tax=Streptomyces sp. NPDC001262 TaxID=3364552 RepID=UPI0036A0BF62